MNKFKIGWLINGGLAIIALAIAFIFPTPAVILPVFAWAALIGTIQSVFTISETKEERELRKAREHISKIPSIEEYKPNTQTYENLHANSNSASFKGEHTKHLDNKNKQEIEK